MARLVIIVLFISNSISSLGQKNFGIKIYQNTDRFEIQNHENRNPTEKITKVNVTRLSLAIDIGTKKGFTHEIELMMPELSKSLDQIQYPMNYEFQKGSTFHGQASSYSMRYELSKTLTSNESRFCFNLGAGINPYYVHIEYIPNVETTFYLSNRLYGFALNVVPRIKYNLSNRFIIDLNIPLKIYDLRGETNHVDNPAIPYAQQTAKGHSNIFFESAYTLRLGFMYKLSK